MGHLLLPKPYEAQGVPSYVHAANVQPAYRESILRRNSPIAQHKRMKEGGFGIPPPQYAPNKTYGDSYQYYPAPMSPGPGYYSPRYGPQNATPSPRPSPKIPGHSRRASHAVPQQQYAYASTRGGTPQYVPDFTSPRYQATPQHTPEYVPIYDQEPKASRPRRRASHSTRPQPPPQTTKRPPPVTKTTTKATEEDARRAGIPAGYSYKNWDPTEEPIMLLGNVFDANSLGKWIYDWTVFHHDPGTPLAEMASELWLLLIQLAGKERKRQESVRDSVKVELQRLTSSGRRTGKPFVGGLKWHPDDPVLLQGLKGPDKIGKAVGARNTSCAAPSSTTSSEDTTTIYEIPIVLPDPRNAESEPLLQINAFGDYCAKFNFIKEDYATRLGLPINRNNTQSITVGSGKKITTIGTTSLPPFRFHNETESHLPLFHVIPKCLHNIILGRSFLKMTQTFSAVANFARRVKERVLHGVAHHFLYLGDSMPRFSGLINGKPQEALADSGAKVLIMDEDFARLNKFTVDREERYRTTLRFADETTAETSGIVHGVPWEFGPGGAGTHFLDFHILRNAPANVVLNDSFLFHTEAFSRYSCYLVDDNDEDEDAFFFAVDVDKRQRSRGSTDPVSTSAPEHIELVLRGEKDDEISALPLNEQATARAIEDDRRAEWNRSFATLQQVQSRSAANGSSASSTTQPTTSSSSDSQPSPGPSLRKFSRWRRFKLKRKD